MSTLTVQDVTVPRLGLGTWELEGQTAHDAVTAALELGYRHIDTAQAYGNEEHVGNAIAASDVDRDDIFLTTKVWRDNAGAQAVVSSTEESLDKLGVDHVDLLLLHWPSAEIAPLEETLGALDKLRTDGRTRLIGVSNFPSDLFRTAADIAPLATNQVEYHALLGQQDVLAAARDNDAFVTAYSPLAHGELIGHDTLGEIAEAHDRSSAQVAIRWLLAQDDVAVIPRSSSRDHIAANHDVDFELTDDQVATIDGLPKDQRQIDPPFAPDWD